MMRAEDPSTRPVASAKKPRKRLVKAAALMLLAVLSAVGAAVLLTRYMDARTAAARVPTVRVVTARVDIPIATPIKAEWLAAVDWPTASGLDGASENPADLVDRIAIVPIAKGEPVIAARLAEPGARGGLATLVSEGMRAVAVRVDDVVGVAGFLHPGDRVDVIVTMAPGGQEPPTAKVILQNVKVLAVGRDVQHKGREAEKSVAATVATLMVAPEESERLALASSKGKLLLTLRGMGDDSIEETGGAQPSELLALAGDGKRAPAPAPKAPAPPARRAKQTGKATAAQDARPPEKETVEIIRGDLFEKRDFVKGGGK
jgi:pilus assembly protein CpaB